MKETTRLALEATRRIRASSGFQRLRPEEQRKLAGDLARIESALGVPSPAARPADADDPYRLGPKLPARGLATPADFERDLTGSGGGGGQGAGNGGGSSASSGSSGASGSQPAAPASPPAPPPGALATIGARSADTLQAVNFPGFVASLVTGTFQAIVDSTTQQLRAYADLVASISKSVDDFSRDNVSAPQAREWLTSRYPSDLGQEVPAPGKPGDPRLVPLAGKEGTSPAWLADFGLDGEELSEELTEGPLLDAARSRVGEERMQTLAAMVLMGVSRVVVDDGDISARLQFHASATDRTDAELATATAAQGGNIASRSIASQSAATMMVSTLKANAQADASIKADLMGEVRIKFRTETFPLERFADSAAIQLLNRHARWTAPVPPSSSAPASSQAPAPPAPVPAAAPAASGAGAAPPPAKGAG